jgi:hypothetical protein
MVEKKNTSHLNDDVWIYNNGTSLFDFARIKHQIYGRGVVVVNREDVLQPPQYLSMKKLEEEKFRKLKEFAVRYNPDAGFVISLNIDSEEGRIYRVDFIK